MMTLLLDFLFKSVPSNLVSVLITAALSTFIFDFKSNFQNAVTFYFYLSKRFGLYFYFYLSKKMIRYLYFYSSTQGKYFLQHCIIVNKDNLLPDISTRVVR